MPSAGIVFGLRWQAERDAGLASFFQAEEKRNRRCRSNGVLHNTKKAQSIALCAFW
jgi:hypothetical protein